MFPCVRTNTAACTLSLFTLTARTGTDISIDSKYDYIVYALCCMCNLNELCVDIRRTYFIIIYDDIVVVACSVVLKACCLYVKSELDVSQSSIQFM